ncbi:MAG TPA: RsmB/NOP family class I SAM-dependent RNA methyltransferase, partial [Pyrinomonadaceae bacterium]|nr:RsmB/NOP family class I SAM-dependent RNA methyltransferase [Pyrinomonadaceae bacterium]
VPEAEILAALAVGDASAERSTVTPGAWRVSGSAQILRNLASEGKVYLQDEASQLLAQIVDPQPSERVLDLCAAPGGKATHLAGLAGDRAMIVAADVSPRRLQTVASSVALQQLKSVEVLRLDAGKPLPFTESSFDRVLVDAPCSGTGTLRRNPEIRWRLTPHDVRDLSEQQRLFLSNAAKMVKPGGKLVYSTCSVEWEENEEVVSSFLRDSEHFNQIPATVEGSLLTDSGAVRTWPQHQGTDGFFIAVFERR